MSVTSALPREQAITRLLELTGNPEVKDGQPWLVTAVGLPGSGKSTFCRKLARATGAAILESDALRCDLFVAPTHDREESRRLFDAIYGATRRLLQDGASVIVDATNLRERDRERAYEAAQAAHAALLILHFRAPQIVIADRLMQRSIGADSQDRSTAGMAVYARMAETEEPILRDHWQIDTSDNETTEATLQRAIELLKPRRRTGGGQTRGGNIS